MIHNIIFFLMACSGDKQTDTSSVADTGEILDTGEDDTGTEDTSDTGEVVEPSTEPSTEPATEPSTEPATEISIKIRPSAILVNTIDEEDSLHVMCPFFVNGERDDTAQITTTISPMTDVTTSADHTYHFASSGTYTATCTGTYENETVEESTEIVVLNATQPPEAAQMSKGLLQAEYALQAIQDSNGGADEDLVLAFQDLISTRETLPSEPFGPFRDIPEAFWPDTDTLLENGIMRTTDDDLLPNHITLLANSIDALILHTQNLDPQNTTQEDVDVLSDLMTTYEEQITTFIALEPSMHGWKENALAMQEIIFTPMHTLTMQNIDVNEVWLRDEAGDIVPPPFGLVSMMVGVSAKHSMQMNLASVLYKDVFEAIDATVNNLLMMELIELQLPPQGSISMDYIQASSSHGIALPFYETTIYGSGFSENAGLNTFLIVGVDWQGSIDGILGNCDGSGNNLPQRLSKVKECVDNAKDLMGGNIGSAPGGQTVYEDGVWGDQAVYIGQFPDICGSGWLPVTIGILAWNLETDARTEFTPLTCIP